MAQSSKRDRQMIKSDVSFTLIGILGIVGLVIDSFDANPIVSSAPMPLVTSAVAIGLTAIFGFLVTRICRIDREHSEEYTFQIITSAALVAVVTTMFITLVWTSDLLLTEWMGSPTPGQIIATLMASWSFGYLVYRTRGIVE